MKTIVTIKIEAPKRFDSLGGVPDNRDGMFWSGVRMERLTADGEHVEQLCLGCFSEIAHSGLRKTADDAYHGALDLAYAMRNTVEAMGAECYISPPADCWQGSSSFLSWYLEERKEKVEKQQRKAEMIARAKALLAEAKNL